MGVWDVSLSTRTTRPDARRGGDYGMMWRRKMARRNAWRKEEEEEDSGGGGQRRARWERKRRVVWTSNLREQGRGWNLGGGCGCVVVRCPSSMRRRSMRRGGEELGRRRIREGVRRGGGREAAEEEGEEGCVWWRSGGGGGLGLVESIYINITMNVDRPIARSTAPGDRGVGGLT
jgi:hypothetical protein